MDNTSMLNSETAPTTSIFVKKERPCAVCGTPTLFVDYCCETPLCSKHCQDEYYDSLFPSGNDNGWVDEEVMV